MRMVLATGVVLLAACSSGVPGSGTHACTLIGCQDQFTATAQDANGSLPSGMHTIQVTADGATLSCSFTLPLANLPGGGTAGIDCPIGLHVQVLQPSTCIATGTPNYKTQTCTPVAGKLNEIIVITGKPTTVHVTETVDGATFLDETATPAYKTSQPNGPDCDPICSQASAEWVLAAR
jgi:hypothetical protein